MPLLRIADQTIQVEQGKRLVLAIEESGIAIGHRCGGEAHCTSCKVKFISGEPEIMTRAEFTRLAETGLLGEVRLACQIVCDQDMILIPLLTAEDQPEWEGDTGPAPNPKVMPDEEWFTIQDLTNNT